MLDAILNNNTLGSPSRTGLTARDRAESWGGMSDLSHAAAIISAGTTIGGASTTVIGPMGSTLGGAGGDRIIKPSESPVGMNGVSLTGGMRPASPPSVAASFEVFLSSPRSLNTMSGCGILVDGGVGACTAPAAVEASAGVGVGASAGVGVGVGAGVGVRVGVGVGSRNGSVGVCGESCGDCGVSNGSLGIAALEGVDLMSDLPLKTGFGVPVKITVPDLGNSGSAGDLEILELVLEKEEEAMMEMVVTGNATATATGNTNADGTNGFWRERLDSISMGSIFNRDRNDSISSLPPSRKDSFTAAGSLSGIKSVTRERFDSLASLGECSMNMSITDLADVAGALESVVAQSSSAVGTNADGTTKRKSCKVEADGDKNSAANFPPPTIQVDSDAVQAAVLAAMAATNGNNFYDMLRIGSTESATTSLKQQQKKQKKVMVKLEPVDLLLPPTLPPCPMSKCVNSSSTVKKRPFLQRIIPTVPDSSRTSEEEKAIRARARAAAGYIPPINNLKFVSAPSLKRRNPNNHHDTQSNQHYSSIKRPRMTSNHPLSSPSNTLPSAYLTTKTTLPTGVVHLCASNFTTPKRVNTKKVSKNKVNGTTNLMTAATSAAKNSSKGQSEQKWEEMFQCLVQYVEEQKEKEIRGMAKEAASEHLVTWEWSGNVPTMYKRKDGKALGRWINNQRSAKSKGTLKMDREVRLVSTGLKWSVLTTNAWTDMMEELRIYVREQTKNGGGWNGNVPTNYKIKNNTATDGSEIDEDKNLGRWINRQRSLYQADKLKKERQIELEKVGLKWAVLSTTSWHAMYDTLCKYAQERRNSDKNSYWDGNVPASHETDDKPPKRLGRWVNRQRSAYATDKLKKEFVIKLEKIGLKWTAHDKKLLTKVNSENDAEIANLKIDEARVIVASASEVVLQNGKKTLVGQHTIRKQCHEPTLFLNGKGLDPISAPKLPVVPALVHKNISNAKNGNSAVMTGL